MGRPKKKNKGDKPPEFRHVGLRASAAWAEWLDRAAAHCRTDTAKLLDTAVCDYVRAKGFEEPPPPRY